MEEKEKRVVCILLIVMTIVIFITIIIALKNKNSNKEVEYVQPIKEIKKEEPILEKYTNYTEASITLSNEKDKLDLKIIDGTFTMKFNNTSLKLTGINEKIKSFTYDQNAYVRALNNSGVFILLLSENNNLYAGFYEDGDNILFYKKINTNQKIKDITINEVISDNKSLIRTSAVLENGEIRPIIDSGNIYILSDKDMSKYEKVIDNLVISKDGTISIKNNINNKLQYNKHDIIVNKIFVVMEENNSNDYLKCYYIIMNNKLYKLCAKNNNDNNPSNFDDIELANKKTIITTTNLSKGYIDKNMDFELTYDDNSREKIKIMSAYIR